jgi:repressor LexA
MLTVKQRDVLAYIGGRIQASGISPSYQEIADALKIRSKGNVSNIIKRLVERGQLRRMENKWRALEVVEQPVQREVYFMWDDERKELRPWPKHP